MELQLPKEVARYRLDRHIASGGMADIYLAQGGGAQGFGRLCVVKRVRPELRAQPMFRDRFEREARIAASLHHPNIISVFDLIEEDGELYLAMEHIDGASLSELRGRLPGQVMPVWAVTLIGLSLARALEYAHGHAPADRAWSGVIHRDISPQNVLIGRHGEIKLIDFGIARPTNAERSGGLAGKVAYLAPEQARGGDADARTDLFGLGVMLFELLTGDRPYPGGTDLEQLEELKTGSTRPVLAQELRPEVPAALSNLIDEAVQRRPANRPASARAMADALEAILRDDASYSARDLEKLVQEALGPPTEPMSPIASARSGSASPTPAMGAVLPTSTPGASPHRKDGSSRRIAFAGLSALLALSVATLIYRAGATAPEPSVRARPTVPVVTIPPSASLVVAASPPAPIVAPEAPRPVLESVRLIATPFASVTLDGRATHDADPFTDVKLTRGKHKAVFHYGGQDKSVDFMVTNGAGQKVEVAFTSP